VSGDDGLFDEMSYFSLRRRAPAPLDDDTATRLLDGALHAGDAPPGYAEVAGLLGAAAAPPTPTELAGEAAARAAFRETRQDAPPTETERRRRRAPVLVAAGLFLVLLSGTAVAAATGSLPGGMQGTAHDLLDGIGVSVPDRGHDAAGRAGSNDRRTDGGAGQADVPGDEELTAASASGLCQAYTSGAERKERATAFERLAAAAQDSPGASARERVASYCAVVATAHPATTVPPMLAPDTTSGNGNSGGGTGNPANGNGNGGNSGDNANGGNPNANGGNPNANGGNPNANGGNPNANGGNGRP
jgi:hypothetical protein